MITYRILPNSGAGRYSKAKSDTMVLGFPTVVSD